MRKTRNYEAIELHGGDFGAETCQQIIEFLVDFRFEVGLFFR